MTAFTWTIPKVCILYFSCHLLAYGSAHAQPIDPEELERFLTSTILDVYVEGEGGEGSPVSAMEFLREGVVLVTGLASSIDALRWTAVPTGESIHLVLGFDHETEPHLEEHMLVIGLEEESLLLEADPPYYDSFSMTLSRPSTAATATPHSFREALQGSWIVESIDGVPLDESLGYVFDGDGGFAELGERQEVRRHLPVSRWHEEDEFVDLHRHDFPRYDVRATLRTDVEATEAVGATLAERLAGVGLDPPRVTFPGDGRIEVTLHGVAEPAVVAHATRPRSRLEFRLMTDPRAVRDARTSVLDVLDEDDRQIFRVWPPVGVPSIIFSKVEQRDTATVREILARPNIAALIPSEMNLMWYARDVSADSDEPATYLLGVRSGAPDLTQEVIIESRVEFDVFTGLPTVSLAMNDEGAAKWEELTGRNVGREVAIIVDGVVYSFPRIIDQIPGGRTQITGVTPQEAEQLAVLLAPGVLPAPVEILEIETSRSRALPEGQQTGTYAYGSPVGWHLSTWEWQLPGALPDQSDATGPVLVLLYEGEIPTTFIVTELSRDRLTLLGAGSNVERTTLTLRREAANQ